MRIARFRLERFSTKSPPPVQDELPPPVQDALPPTTQLDSPTEDKSLDLTYQNSSLGFKMNYPDGWITQEFDYDPSDPITNIVTFTSPFENTEDKFTENLVVSFQEISDPSMTAEKYVEQAISFYKDYYEEDPNFIDKNTTMVNISGNNYPSYTLVYTEDIYNDKDNPVITAERGYIIGDKAYTFQYARNNQSTFASYLPIVEDMINSFELISPTEN